MRMRRLDRQGFCILPWRVRRDRSVYGGLADIDTELKQLTMYSRRAP
jgi:hypothetical protein